jgi:hypothetical protein
MSTYKNISDDWYITLDGGVGTIYIDGNLDVTGNITYVSEIAVNDAFIIVAANNSPTANVTDSGLIATKPTSPQQFAGLRFDTVTNRWQISSNVTATGAAIDAYQDLASGGSGIPGGANTNIQINDGAGGFLGNANFSFDFTTSKVTLTGHQVLGNIGTAPTAVANSVAIYNNAPGAGQTGVYAVGTTTTADELISLTRAKLYAIIF